MRSTRLARRAAIRTEAHAELDLEGLKVACLLRYSTARRTVAMRVDAHGRVVINLPMATPVGHMEAFIRQHRDWLRRQIDQVCRAEASWASGALLPYLGGWLRLEEVPGIEVPQRRADCLLIPDLTRAQVTVPAWYRREAQGQLATRLHALCQRHGLPLPVWRLSDARSRWGSLSAKGVISLNWRLVKATHAEMDYVICHELAHLRQRNHSPAFWREVAMLYPDYAAARRLLRQNGRLYFEF